MGEEFQVPIRSYGIKSRPTTIISRRAQAIVEQLHLTIGNQLRTFLYEGSDWKEDINMLHTTTSPKTPHSPSQLVFSMDIIFCQKVQIDWAILNKQRCKQALANNKKREQNPARPYHSHS